VSGPISVAAAGYLYSEHDVRTPLKATIVNGVVWVALTALLLEPVGVAAVGIGWMLASWTEAVMFSRALRLRASLTMEKLVCVPVAIAFASAFLGRAARPHLSSRLVDGITIAVVAVVAYVALSLAFNRSDLLATARRVRSLI
jgi:peptidoglycan biosynthesis protein MviN/MurJ (putative lipid II flippase)